MAASKLSIYQGAALICKERKVTSLSEGTEVRNLLDDVWDRRGLNTCLQMGMWNFAKRGAAIEYDSSISTSDLGGYQYAIQKPSDYIRTISFCTDAYFRNPTTAYEDAVGYWWTDFTPAYVQYVSNDTSYGLDYSLWPPNFERFVESFFAWRIIRKLTTDKSLRDEVAAEYNYWMSESKKTDAMEQPTKFPPISGWSAARGGTRSRGYGDRGNTGSLTG